MGVNAHFLGLLISTFGNVDALYISKGGVNAHFLGLLISTLPLKIPSIYAAYRACFCGYFSEYSDSSPKKGSKVGRRRIVFLRYNFFYVIC